MIIGTVPYYNSLPLVAGLGDNLVSLPPRQLTEALLRGDIDVGLIPVFNVLKHGLYDYPEAGVIGCDGMVSSVGLFTKDTCIALEDITSIYFDHESQTSVQLARVLMNKLFNRNLRSIVEVPLERCHEADAQLLIGDKALFFHEDGYKYWDLGSLWKQLTGCGFVFACWASNRQLSQEEIKKLTDSRLTASQCAVGHHLAKLPKAKQTVVLKYLTDNIVYDYTPVLKRGYELFEDYVNELDLLEESRLDESKAVFEDFDVLL